MTLRFLIIFSIIGLAEYYSFFVIRSSVRNFSPAWRYGLLGGYLLVTALAWVGLIFFRAINWAAMPHLLRNLYIAFVLGLMVGKILVLLVMLVDDIRRLFTWLIMSIAYRNNVPAGDGALGISRSVFLRQTALVLGGLSLLGFTWGITNRYSYRVRKVKLRFPSLPDSFRGMKVVQISDIHTGSFDNHAAVAHGIERVMDQGADLILFTGDLVNNQAHEVDEKYQQIFSRLKAPLGVYSTLGNQDYGDYVSWPDKQSKIDSLPG